MTTLAMDYESVISWLMQSDWLFLVLCVAALVGAFAVAFPEPTAAAMTSRKITKSGPQHS